ncbi:G-PROTEIN-RECEP-F1-2 domain-containing protein [Aphelenchoides fujianensis]|nr:G-PROTEIN-RECEP-F1-2 domain-containing protein [Aphelenchoides fujianensis]
MRLLVQASLKLASFRAGGITTLCNGRNARSLGTNEAPLGANFSDLLEFDQLSPAQLEENRFVTFLYLSFMPVCCLVGLTGNSLVWILITSNQIFRRLPSSAYLLALSLMSSAFLVSLLSFWVEEGFIKDAHERHSAILCKGSTFIAHCCDFASVWLIVLVGFERLTLLYKATFRRSLVNSRRQVAVLVLIAALCNVWILFVAEVNEFGGCDIDARYEDLYNGFTLFETVVCMVIPSIFIICSNVLVISKLRAHFKRIPSSPSVSFNTADVVFTSGPTQTVRSTKISKASLVRLSSRLSVGRAENNELILRHNRRQSLRYTDIQLTRSLVIITTAFLALNLPNYIYRVLVQLHVDDSTAVMNYLRMLAHVLLYSHHALLFYVYIFNSPQMRKAIAAHRPEAARVLLFENTPGSFGHRLQLLAGRPPRPAGR